MKSLKEDGFTEIMEMFRLSDIEEPIPKREKKEESTPWNKELKVGDYYIREGWTDIRRIHKVVDRKFYYQAIHTDTIRSACNNDLSDKGIRKLTHEEIKEALIKEAKSRGYKKGISSYSLLDKAHFKATRDTLEVCDNGKERGVTVSLDGKWIYLNGEWAIIE